MEATQPEYSTRPCYNGIEHLEWKRLLLQAQQISPLLVGQTHNFEVQPVGEPIFKQQQVWIRADALSNAQASDTSGLQDSPTRRVVLQLRSADWPLIKHASGTIKVLQAGVRMHEQDFVLDCTDLRSVLVVACPVRQDTSLRAAEFFSGGFAGWSQAAYLMHTKGVPIHMSWTIDVDPDCKDMLSCQHAEWCEVTNVQELCELPDNQPFHICANINWAWWLRAFLHSPIDVACVSPPCQPWSRAGRESGLHSEEGMLVLRVIDILGAFAIPIVLFEQVANFAQHPHHAFIMQAWQDAGYTILWQSTLDLVDVLPGHRSRFLLVLGHRSLKTQAPLTVGAWHTQRRQNLGMAKVLMPLPPALKQANTPDAATLDIYMDPYFVPSPRCAGLRPQTPEAYRLKKATDVATTFMAQYQFQHLLPPRMLEKGILGTLVFHEGVVRFFSGPEIAAIHGAVRPIYLSHDRQVQMRLLGNSIAIPHALVPLSIACLVAKLPQAPEPAQAIHWCMMDRLHNQNSVLMPVGADWVFCRRDQTAAVTASLGPRLAELADAPIPEAFAQVTMHLPAGSAVLFAPPDMPPQALFALLGCPAAASQLPPAFAAHLQSMEVQLLATPQINLGGFIGSCGSRDGLGVVLTADSVYVMELSTPTTWSQLLRVFRDIEPGPGELAIFSACGQRLLCTDHFTTCMIAVPEADEIPIQSLSGLAPHIPALSLTPSAAGLQLNIQESAVIDCWMCLPFHLIAALGWESQETFALQGQPGPLLLDLSPRPDALHMPVDIMQDTWRIWCFVAQLEHAVASPPETGIDVEVQLVARRLWTGRLPGDTNLQAISHWWQQASQACHLLPGHRVFSGPHPKLDHLTLQDLKHNPATCVLRQSGRLLVTIHPELRGGGAKTETSNWAKTRAASLCLAHGVDLSATTTFVDQLAAAAGIQRLSMTLQEGPADGRWNALLDLAKQSDVPAPALQNLQAKAEHRARQAQQRKHRHHRNHITAAEVHLSPGFFLNEDGSTTNILTAMQPGVSGIKLVDESEAIGLLQALRGVQPDELGLLVLGHSCPAPEECNGHLTFPATSVACGSKLLLAGCLHNVGGRRIRTHVADDIRVDLPNQCCCTIDCYADELDQDAWTSLLTAPVRNAAEAFKKQGVEAPFTDPWGRAFSLAAKPSLPALADKMSFQARVAHDRLDALLAASGHNHFYVTPRAIDRSILTSYAIIWIGTCRAEALRASLQVPGQLGLARVKNRYGLRVAEKRFAEVFAQLRPGQMIPTKVQVTKMFRVGPLPPEAGAAEIVTWAGKAAWNVKVIKSLGARHWL